MTEEQKQSLDVLEALFPSQYDNADQVQGFLIAQKVDVYTLKGSIRRFEEQDEKRKEDFQENKIQLVRIAEHLPAMRTILPTLTDPVLTEEYTTKIENETMKEAELQGWMERNNPNKYNQAFLKYHIDKESLEYLIAAGHRLGEWFATGAAGPGTVTFMDKTYTAS